MICSVLSGSAWGQAPVTSGANSVPPSLPSTGDTGDVGVTEKDQGGGEVRPGRAAGGGPPPFFPTGPAPFRYLRYEEDFSDLRDPARRTDPWDLLKFIPLNPDATSYLTLGGETW